MSTQENVQVVKDGYAAFSRGDIDPTPTVGPTFGLDHIAEAFAAVRNVQVQGRASVTP